jgi:hypothetical protein
MVPQLLLRVRKVAAFLGMVVVIGLVGIALGLLAAVIGIAIQSGEGDFKTLAAGLGGMVVGYPIGVILGILLINKFLHYRGSLLFGASGSLLGAVFNYARVEYLNLDLSLNLLLAIALLAPAILGAAGYHLRGRRSGSGA